MREVEAASFEKILLKEKGYVCVRSKGGNLRIRHHQYHQFVIMILGELFNISGPPILCL